MEANIGMTNENILITGGCGFIGSHLADSFALEGKRVVVVDVNGVSYRNPEVEYRKISILENDKLAEVMKGMDVVYHLAALKIVKESINRPHDYVNTNINGTINVLEAARKADVSKVIFASSSTVYGRHDTKIKENFSSKPESIYGFTKHSGALMMHLYSNSCGIKTSTAIMANIYGPRSNSGIIYDFIKKLRANPEELEIIGDGSQKKQYLHISDCVNALKLIQNTNGTINIAPDNTHSAREIASKVSEVMGVSPNFKFTGNSWKGDIENYQLDNSKLKSIGWSQKIELTKGIKSML